MRCIRPRSSLVLAAALIALAAPAGAQTSPAETAVAQRAGGVDVAGMDRSVAPGDDFFRYANGTWVKTTEIPADRSSYGAGEVLTELTDRRTADLIKEAAAGKAAPGSDLRKIGDFYTSFMDSSAIDAAGLRPLQPTLDSIARIEDRKGLAHMLGSTIRADVDVLNNTNPYTENILGLWVAQDLDDPSHYSPFLLQGGLGMPDRSFYLDSSSAMATIRQKYRQHVAAMLALAKVAGADAKADAIMRLETRIAAAHASREATGDVTKGNNHWSLADFGAKAPGLDWPTFFAAAGLAAPRRFVVWQPGAVTGISALAASEPVETWKDYLTFHAIQSRAAVLPSAYYNHSFAFFGPVLSGAEKPRDRWKRAVEATNEALGFAVGRLYAARYFPPADKARAQAMVANIIAAFRSRIDGLEWMAPATKAQAKAKLAVLKVGVGYPDKWPGYSGLEIKAGDAFGNAERASLLQLHRAVARLTGPVDRSEWVMTPQTVNAVNLPAMNAMNFPAAILQPPYFDPNRPLAMDYGAMGAIIGHEVSHSFDNQGALFDARGRLHNWWTPADFKHFEASSAQLVAQYDAYHRAVRGKEPPVVQGFTGDQQFFLSYAQSWRAKYREPAVRNRIVTDGHAPDMYRAATVRNLDAWYRAFDVKQGQGLYLAPAERVRVW
jgi:predicted metalloendopeptidase